MNNKTKTVLLVDDEELIREVLSTLLRSNGYEVEAVENGRQAMRKVERQAGGNKTRASVLLEISIPTLLYKIKAYEIDTGK